MTPQNELENESLMFYCIGMATTTAIQIPKLKFREPRRNLPGKASGRNGESKFTLQFARAYQAQYESLHHGSAKTSIAYAREVPVNGFGIADFVAINWDASILPRGHVARDFDFFVKFVRPTVRAFELKLKDWRRAMMQANRYRYFADAAIVVLPINKLKIAAIYLDTFKTINVGLWGFNPEKNQIIVLYTPRSGTSLTPRHKIRAIELLAKASKFLHFV